MIQRIIIIGGHIQALGIARQVAQKGIEVVLLCDSNYSIARYSNTLKHHHVYHNNEELKSYIQNYYLPNRACLLFPTTDEGVLFLCEEYKTLSRDFYLGIPQPDITQLFNNKRTAYQFVESCGIPCPRCWYPDSLQDVESLADTMPYPVIVKPAVMYRFHKQFRKKAFRCDNAEDLLRVYQQLVDVAYPLDELLIQEFLGGGAKCLYSYATFAVDGIPHRYLIANRIRQNPMDFGNSTTFAYTCNVSDIQKQSELLLNETKYFGLAEVEWMYDLKTNTYKFLEVNTRAWKWHTISNAFGFSYVGAMIDYINKQYTSVTDLPSIDTTAKLGWVERLTDWTVIAKEILKGRMSMKQVMQSYCIPKEYAVWNKHDIKPWVMYLLLSPILYFKRH